MGIFRTMFGGAPEASSSAPAGISAEKKKARLQRSSLFKTEGGVEGEEVGSVKQRGTLLGN